MNIFKNKLFWVTVSVSTLIGIFYVFSRQNIYSKAKFNPAFSEYITAYTYGKISTESPVRIQFTNDIVSQEVVNQSIENGFLQFSPTIEGKAFWSNKNTLEFIPNKALPSAIAYKAKLKIGSIIQMPKELETFEFDFQTMPQSYEVDILGIFYTNKTIESMVLRGYINTFDPAENQAIEKMFPSETNIKWTHENSRKHLWEIKNIARNTSTYIYKNWLSGKEIGAANNLEINYTIPSKQKFEVISADVLNNQGQFVKVVFSDPLLESQNIVGLISLGTLPEFRTVVDANVLYIYPPAKQAGDLKLHILGSLKNSKGTKLEKLFTKNLQFDELKPAIRILGKGIIVPSSNGFTLPFEAVNVKAVEVSIFKIHSNNIVQFFQTNSYADNYGPSELRRVGKKILHKLVPIINTNSLDYNYWKKYAIDLSELVSAEPNAIYQVSLRFKKEHSTYSCDGKQDFSPIKPQTLTNDETLEESNAEYDYYSNEDYYYPSDYDYQERDNVCSNSYYTSENTNAKRLLYFSDIGLIAKRNSSGQLSVFASNILLATPEKDVDISVYDFQNQLLYTQKTDNDGKTQFNGSSKPFLVVAQKNNQSSYLKLDESVALANTFFDVSGAEIQKGIKGFCYGERGVWRPGDSLFLTFLVEDKSNKLPEHYPVSLEIQNPQGQVIHQTVSTKDINRFYNFVYKTDESAPTGHWKAVFKIGGAKFYKDIRIETIMPNRLKINLDFDKNNISSSCNTLSATLKSMWLHGTPASNLLSEVNLIYTKSETKFKGYERFDFDDISKSFYTESQQILNQKLDNNGIADFSVNLTSQMAASGMLNANFNIKVYEDGGATSSSSFVLPYSPFRSYIGIAAPKSRNDNAFVYETAKPQTIEIANVSEKGEPINSNVEVALFKLEWRWWFDKSDSDILMDFNAISPIKTEKITIQNGKGNFKIQINDTDWGRYLLRVSDKNSGHTATKILYFDWAGYATSTAGNPNGASVLSVSTDKKIYQLGEKIKINIPSAGIGKALVCIESGSDVVQSHWIDTKQGITVFEIEATEKMTPNVFINVTLLQPYNQAINDMPIRMFGICPVTIQNKNTVLKPQVFTNTVFKPLENCKINIKEENGKAMTYTLAVVDEGLLDITKFSTPDPYAFFYAKEALGITTWDLYDYVMGSTAKQFNRLLSIGGDLGLTKGKDTQLNRFRPVVKFLGPFSLKAGSENSHVFDMPNYIGSLKIMVVAANKNAFGNAQKIIPVRKPLMILATLPRVCRPDEEILLPVNIFAMDNKIKIVNLKLQTSGVVTIQEPENQSINLNGNKEGLVYFKLKVKPTTGNGSIKVIATSANETAIYEVKIVSINPNTEQTKIIEKTLQPNEEWVVNTTPIGVFGTNTATLEVSNMPAINLESRINFLINYPYGCVEQTTSTVFSQLILNNFVKLSDTQLEKISNNIKVGIARLATFQTPEGGLGYWQGDSETNEWATNYAYHFLLEAEKLGYAVPVLCMQNLKRFQQKMARNYQSKPLNSYSNDQIQAYRLYVLVLANAAELGAMNRLKENAEISTQAAWQLANAYSQLGQNEAALSLVSRRSSSVQYTNNEQFTNNYFGSDIRDNALILDAMVQLGLKEKAFLMAKNVAAHLANQTQLNTQEIAYSLLAISKMLNSIGNKDELKFLYSCNNQKNINVQTALPIAQQKIGAEIPNKITIKNSSRAVEYARIILNGIPLVGNESAYENNIILDVKYTNNIGAPIDITHLKQGTKFLAIVKVKHPGILPNYNNLALKQLFPSGWEITNTRMDNLQNSKNISNYIDYQDIRDDRIYTFFSLPKNETIIFSVNLTASYVGKFYLPAQSVSTMYQNQVDAAIKGKWINVLKNEGIN